VKSGEISEEPDEHLIEMFAEHFPIFATEQSFRCAGRVRLASQFMSRPGKAVAFEWRLVWHSPSHALAV
jgi:hypothetical protein